ncbi:MAG: DNA (cytosine-5-)-methyltransferase [Candidatus Babeliaceae bacterium]|nr:DNA (cytosine-5-)-methyltransferase [Candidatus Babeliaceae bacterium]
MEGKGKIRKPNARGVYVSLRTRQTIQSLRHSAQLSIQELASKSLVSEKTLKKIENPNERQDHFDEEIIVRISRALGTNVGELEESATDSHFDHSFEVLVEYFREIDHKILPLIRDHRHAPREIITEEYQCLLQEHLRSRGISLSDLDQRYLIDAYRKFFLQSLPTPCLTVEISEDLDKISFILPSKRRLSIKSPTLLWDCHCDTPSSRVKEFQCPIHDNKIGKEIHANFTSGYVLIKYRDLQFYWRRGQELWPPSIDSFYMLQNLKKDGVFHDRYHSVLDVGSGTGFLGIAIAAINPYIAKLVLSDWLLTPYLYGMTNWLLNRKTRTHISCKGNVGLFTTALDSQVKPYDLVICNPPYLPLLKGFDELGLESTVAGTELLTDIIEKNSSLGKKLYIQFSDLAKPEAQDAQRRAGVKLRPVGDKNLVPFRLKILWERKDYLKLLLSKRGLIEKKNARHPYWHTIQTYAIEPQ